MLAAANVAEANRLEGESRHAQRSTTVRFAGRSSEPICGTRDTRNTVPNRPAARRAKWRVSAPEWPKRRTTTTFADARMSRGCSHGERTIRGTGGERRAKGGRQRGAPIALPDICSAQAIEIADDTQGVSQPTLQDLLLDQPAVLIGFIAQFTGSALHQQ